MTKSKPSSRRKPDALSRSASEFAARHAAWQRAYDKAEEMLAAIDRAAPTEGEAWADGMRRHWTSRLAYLQGHEPKP